MRIAGRSLAGGKAWSKDPLHRVAIESLVSGANRMPESITKSHAFESLIMHAVTLE